MLLHVTFIRILVADMFWWRGWTSNLNVVEGGDGNNHLSQVVFLVPFFQDFFPFLFQYMKKKIEYFLWYFFKTSDISCWLQDSLGECKMNLFVLLMVLEDSNFRTFRAHAWGNQTVVENFMSPSVSNPSQNYLRNKCGVTDVRYSLISVGFCMILIWTPASVSCENRLI